MILLFFCLFVPAALFTWKLCAAAGEADDRMEAMLHEMTQVEQGGSQAASGCPDEVGRAVKEDANAG